MASSQKPNVRVTRTDERNLKGFVYVTNCPGCGLEKRGRRDVLRASPYCRPCGWAVAAEARTKHGMYHSAEYKIWGSMIQRCTNPNATYFEYYGGRGIQVCERWRTSFDAFYADMGPRPPGFQLDRSDSNGHYEPGNVAWVSRRVQSVFRQKNARGTRRHGGKWQARIRRGSKQVSLGLFATEEAAREAYSAAVTEIIAEEYAAVGGTENAVVA